MSRGDFGYYLFNMKHESLSDGGAVQERGCDEDHETLILVNVTQSNTDRVSSPSSAVHPPNTVGWAS